MVSTSSIFILSLVFVGSFGGSIHWKPIIEDQLSQALKQGKGSTILADYGGAIKTALEGIIATLPPAINVTSLPVDLNNLGENIPVRGQLNLTNIAITGLAGLTVPVSVLNVNGILAAIPLNLRVASPSIKLEADFSIRASLANLIPIRGSGKITLDLSFVFGVDAVIKAQIGSPMVMTMPSLDISLGDFNHLGVVIDGQIGGPGDLSKEIIGILEEYTGPVLAKVSAGLTKTISGNIIAIFNSLKLTFAQLLDLINQIAGPKP